ncbi:hypothetical protein OKW32_000137 [Paraburkholderia youngii]
MTRQRIEGGEDAGSSHERKHGFRPKTGQTGYRNFGKRDLDRSPAHRSVIHRRHYCYPAIREFIIHLFQWKKPKPIRIDMESHISFSPAPTARTDDESTAAYERSSCPDSRNLSSRNACSLFQTPAFCHASRRRQQVAPDPNTSSDGKWFHRIPVRNTNRTPLSAARSDTRDRPRRSLFRRLVFGSSGSISAHNSSSMIGACIPSVSVL